MASMSTCPPPVPIVRCRWRVAVSQSRSRYETTAITDPSRRRDADRRDADGDRHELRRCHRTYRLSRSVATENFTDCIPRSVSFPGRPVVASAPPAWTCRSFHVDWKFHADVTDVPGRPVVRFFLPFQAD
jgi:hypothetical protein